MGCQRSAVAVHTDEALSLPTLRVVYLVVQSFHPHVHVYPSLCCLLPVLNVLYMPTNASLWSGRDAG
jgi:hypothetical protein